MLSNILFLTLIQAGSDFPKCSDNSTYAQNHGVCCIMIGQEGDGTPIYNCYNLRNIYLKKSDSLTPLILDVLSKRKLYLTEDVENIKRFEKVEIYDMKLVPSSIPAEKGLSSANINLKYFLNIRSKTDSAKIECSFENLSDTAEDCSPLTSENIFLGLKKKYKWSEKIWKTIINHKISLGMSPEQVRLSWGDPVKINSTISTNGQSEQWIYESQYLYFDNGKLKTIQNFQ